MLGCYEEIKVVKSLDPIAVSATFHSTGVDRSDFTDALIVVYLGIGATLAAGVYYTLTFEESDTLASSYTTIADADIESGLSGTKLINSTAKDEQLIVRGYKGKKKYVRVTGTLSGVDSTGTTLCVFVLLANEAVSDPVTQTAEA